MFGKLLKSVKIETINELGELCDVYFPKGLYVEITMRQRHNQGLSLDKEVKEVIKEIKRDEEINNNGIFEEGEEMTVFDIIIDELEQTCIDSKVKYETWAEIVNAIYAASERITQKKHAKSLKVEQ